MDEDYKIYRKLFYKRRKKYNKIEGILKEWYGDDRGSNEFSAYLPGEINLSDAVDELIAKNLGPNEQKLMNLRKSWAKLMGNQINKISRPVSLKNRILQIEVENSAWLMELKNFHGRTIEKKIKQEFGEKFCSRILYVLKGARNY